MTHRSRPELGLQLIALAEKLLKVNYQLWRRGMIYYSPLESCYLETEGTILRHKANSQLLFVHSNQFIFLTTFTHKQLIKTPKLPENIAKRFLRPKPKGLDFRTHKHRIFLWIWFACFLFVCLAK